MFDNVPLDTRHVDARNRKQKDGLQRHNGRRPSIKDFPLEWLPSKEEEASRRARLRQAALTTQKN